MPQDARTYVVSGTRNHFPKESRHTLGRKIDSTFVEILELVFTAGYLQKDKKLPFVQKTVALTKKRARSHLCHCPSNTLRRVSYARSKIPQLHAPRSFIC